MPLRKLLADRIPENQSAIQHYYWLLTKYSLSGFAAPNLEDELKTRDDHKLWSAIWEALLYQHFKSLGFAFKESRARKRGQNGPDLGLTYSGKTIWIEAIVPKPTGIPEEYLNPPPVQDLSSIPHDKKLLRWTTVIKTKTERFAKYIKDGVVAPEDCIVIAVNSCRLQDFAFNDNGISRLPYALEATLPVGALAISVNERGQQVTPLHHTWRPYVANHNGAEVPTSSFLRDEYRHVSAVIGTHQNHTFQKPLHLSLVHNPLAANPLPNEIFAATCEYTCTLDKTHLAIHRHPKDA